MTQRFEDDYAALVANILQMGKPRATRNATTRALFGETLKVSVRNNFFPVLQGRKMFTKGILGEFAAMIRRPTNVSDFEKWGCNYWKKWSNPITGELNLDYGNAWFDFNGVDQVANLKDKLENDPTDRRMIISGWKPDGMDDLSLPCCHHTYQFFVDNGELHMSWSQRSVDVMIGLPSDIVFAAAWLISLAREFNLKPGVITMFLGDCHIYEQHIEGAKDYLYNVYEMQAMEEYLRPPTYVYNADMFADFCEFEPTDLVLSKFTHYPKIELELIA
jgi:thymidylate synthase